MPFKSDKQRKWMHANEPEMAKKWEKKKKKEGNIGITTKKDKTIELTHRKSGKEIVVVNTPSVLKKYKKMGYLISMPEGKIKPKQKISKKEWGKIKKFNKHIGEDGTHYVMQLTNKGTALVPVVVEAAKRDYKAEYKKYGSSKKSKKYRAELNKYNRQKGTYGNGDKKAASHKGGKIVGFEEQSKNRGRREKSRLKKEQKLREVIRKMIREDFAGAYPEHQRKKFDNKRRKQSEVLGYKLTGVNDVRTEIDDATVRESIKKKLKPLVREIMYSIGAGGMTALETGVIHLQADSCYYMGASSSPDKIIVTKVDDNWIEYVKPIDNNSKKMKIERAIGESLILDGSNTWLKTYGRFKENKKIADTLQKNLDGKKGPQNGKVPPSEFDRYVLTVKGTKGSNDVYGAAKQWGVIGHWNGKSGEEAEAELEVYKTYIPQIKKDKQFKVTKQKKGELK